MRTVLASLVASIAVSVVAAGQQAPARTLVAVFAHPDDESAASPLLARYAREGVKVYLIIATDGAAGGLQTSIPRGPELARAPNPGLRDIRPPDDRLWHSTVPARVERPQRVAGSTLVHIGAPSFSEARAEITREQREALEGLGKNSGRPERWGLRV